MMTFYVTGDKHGRHDWITANVDKYPTNSAFILLGDAGLNYYLDTRDDYLKKQLNDTGFLFYCVHGNHEERAENIPGMQLMHDTNVNGEVWYEEEYPNVRYFKIWGDYKIKEYNILVLGGAYSVDKYYRQERGWPWFESEQMEWEEQVDAATYFAVTDKHYHFVFSHTCPISWEPTDLFLNCIDQSKVDKTMENWLDGLKDYLDWGVWCFGHYHADRLERPHVEQYYTDVEDLDHVYRRWRNADEGDNLEWWLTKSPNYYMGV